MALTGRSTSGRALGPHFFMRRPAKGFEGKAFMQFGLNTAMAAAPEILEERLGRSLNVAQTASFRTFADSPIAAKGGVSLRAFENVSGFTRRMDGEVLEAITNTFISLQRFAKDSAMARFRESIPRSSNKGKPPVLRSGRRKPTNQLFHYQTMRSGRNQVTFGVNIRGTNKDIGKLVALEFGLRAGTEAEAGRFMVNTGLTEA